MLPQRPWRNRPRIFWWSVFSLAVGTVAVGMFLMLPPEPRWVLADGRKAVFDAGEGRFASYRLADDLESGPLQLWDTATGDELACFLVDEGKFLARANSEDGRYFVALVKGEQPDTWRIRGVDLRERREWQVDPALGPFLSATFSPACDFVAVQLKAGSEDGSCYTLIETASGRMISRVELPSAAESVLFGRDGACVVWGFHEEDAHHVWAVNTHNGKTTTFDNARLLAVSPDSRCIIADCGDEGIWVGDLSAGSWRCRLKDAKPPIPGMDIGFDTDVFIFRGASKHRYKVSHADFDSVWLEVPAMMSGRVVHFARTGNNPTFSPDGRFVLWHEALGSVQSRTMYYDVRTGRPAWQRTWLQAPGECSFSADSGLIVVTVPNQGHVEFLNADTGETVRTIPMAGLTGLQARLGHALIVVGAPPEEQRHWLAEKVLDWIAPKLDEASMMICLIDLDSGVEMGRLRTAETEEYWLTPDRQSLVTVHPEYEGDHETATTIRCWDMPPRKPLRWVLVVTAAFAVMLLSLHAGWRWLRRRLMANAPSLPVNQTAAIQHIRA